MSKKKLILRRFHVGVRLRICLMLSLIALFTFVGLVFYQRLVPTTDTHVFTYSETSSLNYSVCMNDPERFPEICYSDRNYIANAINHVEANFVYTFMASDLFDFKYTYYITASGRIYERGNTTRVIDEFYEVIYDGQSNVVMSNKNNFVINPTTTIIEYDRYRSIVQDLQRRYNLTLDSTLVVTLHVSIEGSHELVENPIRATSEISLSMPLSEQTLEISLSYQDVNNNEIIRSTIIDDAVNILYYIICIVCLILGCFVFIKLIRFLGKITKSKSIYEKTLDKIQKEYNQIIVDTKNAPDMTNIRIIDVESFEELLDAREVINKPILSVKINREKQWFLISNGDEMFKFVLKAVDLENEE